MTSTDVADRPALHIATDHDIAAVLSARDRPTRLATSWNAVDLMAMEFPEPRWAVPGIICEGVNLLAGPPKVGKSWASLGIAVEVALGGKALGVIPVQGGPVLYLALEDTARRLQTRTGVILAGRPAPPLLTLATSCPPMTQGGDEAIAAWLDAHPDARLVIIDVFAKIRGASMPGASAYDADYQAVGRIKRIADAYSVAVLLIHHVRKTGAEDFLSEVSGTNGIAGAADATLVLKRPRGEADAVLHVTGRDIEEAEHALAFQPRSGAWTLLDGPATDHALPDTRAAIVRWLRGNGPAAPRAITDGTGLDHATVKKTCQRMLTDAQLACDTAGRYRLPGQDGGAP